MATYGKEKTEDQAGLAVVADQFNLNVAGAITQGAPITTSAQTISGKKTFNAMFRIPINSNVAVAGTDQGTAAVLDEGMTIVTGADGTAGVRLPTAVAGAMIFIKGTTAGVLNIYPATGAAINAIAANGVLALASGAIPVLLIATSTTQWYSFPLVAS